MRGYPSRGVHFLGEYPAPGSILQFCDLQTSCVAFGNINQNASKQKLMLNRDGIDGATVRKNAWEGNLIFCQQVGPVPLSIYTKLQHTFSGTFSAAHVYHLPLHRIAKLKCSPKFSVFERRGAFILLLLWPISKEPQGSQKIMTYQIVST